MSERLRTDRLEEGDLFFFYRPKVQTQEVHGREDVQRFLLVLAAKWPRRIYRFFVIGRKKLPDATPGAQRSDRRIWALNVLTSTDLARVRQELGAIEYRTATRGERFVLSAKPLGEGRYQLVRHGDHTELVYVLELPKVPGSAQKEFGVRDVASFVVAVKNPSVPTPGAPNAPPPAYTPSLREQFDGQRWIPVNDPLLLDYENVQLVLLGAHERVEEQLGVRLDVEEDDGLSSAEICHELRVSCARERVASLLSGELLEHEEGRKDLVPRA